MLQTTFRQCFRQFSSKTPSSVLLLDNQQQYQDFIKGDKFPKGILYFTAQWCGPCKMISPIYNELSTKYPNIGFSKVDVDDNEEAAAAAGIRSMPTFQVYLNGHIQSNLQFSGADSARLQKLVEHLDSLE